MFAFIGYVFELGRDEAFRALHFSLDRVSDDGVVWLSTQPDVVNEDLLSALDDLRAEWQEFTALRVGFPTSRLIPSAEFAKSGSFGCDVPDTPRSGTDSFAHVGRLDMELVTVQALEEQQWVDVTSAFRAALPARRPSVAAAEHAALLLRKARLQAKRVALEAKGR